MDPIEEANTFQAEQIDPRCKPESFPEAALIDFDATKVQFDRQSPETLRLRIAGEPVMFSDRLRKELKDVLGPKFCEAALCELHHFVILRALDDAIRI